MTRDFSSSGSAIAGVGSVGKMSRKYDYDGTTPGRPRTKINKQPPEGFDLLDTLSKGLDARGWYRELATRRRQEFIKEHYRDSEFEPITDPLEMDRLMCRNEPVQIVSTALDMDVAKFNGRLVIEIDPETHDEVIFLKIRNLLAKHRAQKPRRTDFGAWVEHRILALYGLLLRDYDPVNNRKQLAYWVFPEIKDNPKAQGDKFDRSRELLEKAFADLRMLRSYPEN